ncbi:MAG: endonuclease/exonuclease/phosphatase family protein [Desulfobacterales bacterium]|nr:endonuclease/exonuclease/phosphatase family protein [Desulfobacterales bacterium]
MTPPCPMDRISVMTLNLRFGLAEDGDDSWEFRKPRIADLFTRYRPDLIGFQEVNDFQIDDLRRILPEYGFIGKRRPAPDFWQHNVIFFRSPFRCSFSDHFFLSPLPDLPSRFAESRWPRQCTIGLFTAGRHRLLAVNTHLDFAEAVQARSAELILDRLAGFPADIPTLLMGDFNSLPDSACHRIFTGKDRREHRAGPFFKPVFSPPYPGTHHRFTGESEGGHIDWILYRGELKAENREVCRHQLNGGYPSDHFPICAEFSFITG